MVVATGQSNGQALVSPRGTAVRELYMAGQQEGKKMAHVGAGAGDYIQVTTFRYVGKGTGEFNMVPHTPNESPWACWQCCCVALCIFLALAGTGWVLWPEKSELNHAWEDAKSVFEQHGNAEQQRPPQPQGADAGRPGESAPQVMRVEAMMPEAIEITGADGPSDHQVNGVYILQEDKFNAKDLFKKNGTDDVWLAFIKGRWYVTDTTRKDDNSGGGWLYSMEVDTDTPADVQQWQEWNGQEWAKKPAITATWRKDMAEVNATTGEPTVNSTSETQPGAALQFTSALRGAEGLQAAQVPWRLSAAHTGCSNWRQIKLGIDTVVDKSDQCGERCKQTLGCVGFNYFETSCSGASGIDLKGSCSLWNGSCTSEPNSCWTDFVMVS